MEVDANAFVCFNCYEEGHAAARSDSPTCYHVRIIFLFLPQHIRGASARSEAIRTQPGPVPRIRDAEHVPESPPSPPLRRQRVRFHTDVF
ncbi:hypothetical protein FIBSPDRAFT_968070 [Athelia psychrophila]|uniref:Uncharacterized protein n=1 Tax=Athelia psychrophila TaxID=1759441 RepID=A0A167V0Q7_9AGAM|nr:hypothetical protein FIBSPDRAFT_968070 [Fibularhizoctonia sp. CBS 109695]